MAEPKPPPAEDPVRSRIMSAVRRRDTRAERALRDALDRAGARYTTNDRSLPGSPDVVFPDRHLAVFVHGCFWHRHPGCPRATMPKSHRDYWERKFQANVERDARKLQALRELGWSVCVVWECEIMSDADSVARRLLESYGLESR
ncbi:MAG: very short patch repair endonuclease [Dehalococcoidia bacterium]|nr:very short patch repair endonuclease [Dehalococcoidia bacterium]